MARGRVEKEQERRRGVKGSGGEWVEMRERERESHKRCGVKRLCAGGVGSGGEYTIWPRVVVACGQALEAALHREHFAHIALPCGQGR